MDRQMTTSSNSTTSTGESPMPVRTTPSNPDMAVIEALIDGLRPTNRPLNQRRKLALLACGKGILPGIIYLAQAEATPPPQRRRLQALASALDQTRDRRGNCRVGDLVYDALLAGLRVEDPRLNECAFRAMCQHGELLADYLVSEAVRQDRNHAYCLRLLQAVERIGRPLTVEQILQLWIVAGTNANESIRMQALRIMMASHRPPKDRQPAPQKEAAH